MSEILAKGANFTGLLKALEALHGTDACERAFSALPQSIADPLRFGQVVAVGWYPVAWYSALHAAVDDCFHEGPMLARKLGRQATRADIGTTHRFFANMLSVETVFGQTHRLMALYWKGGEIERLDIVRGRARLRFEGWHGFTSLIWEDLMGGMEAVLEICGAKNGRAKANGSTEDADTLEIEARWT